MKAGKFLGFTSMRRGIKTNLDKCRVIIQIRNPSMMKEVQRLSGKIIALSHFMSKVADKVAPFFECIKKAESFEWTEDCGRTS